MATTEQLTTFTNQLCSMFDSIQACTPGNTISALGNLLSNVDVSTPIGLAIQVAALNTIANSLFDFSIDNSEQAQTLSDYLIPLFDRTIEVASDAGWWNTTQDLSTMKSVIADYLGNLILTEPELQEVNTSANLPACVIAHKLYRDGSRDEEIIDENDVPFPLFMSTQILAKAW